MSGNISSWSPKQDGPATRRSGASVIVDAKLQRFLLVTQAFQGISFAHVVYAKSCCGMLALVHWYAYEDPQVQLFTTTTRESRNALHIV
jgi:hypothetical protein